MKNPFRKLFQKNKHKPVFVHITNDNAKAGKPDPQNDGKELKKFMYKDEVRDEMERIIKNRNGGQLGVSAFDPVKELLDRIKNEQPMPRYAKGAKM